MSNVPQFCVGDSFSSYSQLKEAIKEFERVNYVELCHRDSRTLAAAKKRVPKRCEKANADIVYYSIPHLTCTFGGKRYKSEGIGKRPRQRYK